jgi:hypothetical protein
LLLPIDVLAEEYSSFGCLAENQLIMPGRSAEMQRLCRSGRPATRLILDLGCVNHSHEIIAINAMLARFQGLARHCQNPD